MIQSVANLRDRWIKRLDELIFGSSFENEHGERISPTRVTLHPDGTYSLQDENDDNDENDGRLSPLILNEDGTEFVPLPVPIKTEAQEMREAVEEAALIAHERIVQAAVRFEHEKRRNGGDKHG